MNLPHTTGAVSWPYRTYSLPDTGRTACQRLVARSAAAELALSARRAEHMQLVVAQVQVGPPLVDRVLVLAGRLAALVRLLDGAPGANWSG